MAPNDRTDDNQDRHEERTQLVDAVAKNPRVSDERVLRALESVPRHLFVPLECRDSAYEDRPLKIGDGQTISAPHMVAIMADLLDLDPEEHVLEIGTGCGYHAAVTATLVGPESLSSVEYSDDLATTARERLEELGFGDVAIRVGDGREGWPERGPFDAIYLTCGADSVPHALVDQLRPGGRLLAPVGPGLQTLVLLRKQEDGSLERSDHGAVRFVRMRG